MTLREAISLIDSDDLQNLPHAGSGGEQSDVSRLPAQSFWADLGCGSGLFTLALAHFLSRDSTIFAIDRQPEIKRQTTPGGVDIIPVKKDFITEPLDMRGAGSLLKGILMANSLHYVKEKTAFLQNLQTYLVPSPVFIIVEYEIDMPVSIWVPYPIRFSLLQGLFHDAGYRSVQKISTRPSAYGRGNLYSAIVQ